MPASSRRAYVLIGALSLPLSIGAVVHGAEPASPTADAPTVDLRTTYERGSEARYEISVQVGRTDRRVYPPLEGQTEPRKNTSTQDTQLELTVDRIVREAKDDGAIIEVIYQRIKIQRRDNEVAMAFDSDSPEANDASTILGPIVRPLVGASVFIEVNQQGQIKTIRADEAAASSKETSDMAQQIMGRDPVSELIGPIIAAKLPPTTVKLGQSWTKANSIPVAEKASINVTRTDTLKSIEDGKAVIDVAGRIKLIRDKDSTDQIPDIKETNMEGSMLWDTKSGMLSSYSVTQMIQTEGTISGVTVSTRNESLTTIRKIEK